MLGSWEARMPNYNAEPRTLNPDTSAFRLRSEHLNLEGGKAFHLNPGILES